MKVVIPALYRAPVFAPEPPILDSEMDVITAPETPFEQYTYLTAFRAKSHLETYLTFFENFLSTCPSFTGPEDDSDVAPPGHVVAIPPHYNQTFVHFLPGEGQVQLPWGAPHQGVAGEAAWGQESQEDPRSWHRARLHCLCHGSHVARGRSDCSGPCCPLHQDGEDVAGDEECDQP